MSETVTHRLSLDRIAAAASLIDPVFLDSPQYRAETLDELFGGRLVATILTGGNITADQMGAWLSRAGHAGTTEAR